MSNWGLATGAIRTLVPNTDDVLGVTLTPTAANTKTAWSELIASCPRNVQAIVVQPLAYMSNPAEVGVLDIGIGPVGSEVVVVPDLPCVSHDWNFSSGEVYLPISIPAGARVAWRAQANAADMNVRARFTLVTHSGLQPIGGAYALAHGYTASTTSGTSLTMGWDWSSTVQIVSSLPRRARGLSVDCLRGDFEAGNVKVLARVSLDAAATHIVAHYNFTAWYWGSSLNQTQRMFAPVQIPAGAALYLSARREVLDTATLQFVLHTYH